MLPLPNLKFRTISSEKQKGGYIASEREQKEGWFLFTHRQTQPQFQFMQCNHGDPVSSLYIALRTDWRGRRKVEANGYTLDISIPVPSVC